MRELREILSIDASRCLKLNLQLAKGIAMIEEMQTLASFPLAMKSKKTEAQFLMLNSVWRNKKKQN